MKKVNLLKSAAIIGFALALGTQANAAVIVNGGFESFSGSVDPSQVFQTGLVGSGYDTLTGWTNNGFTFLFGGASGGTSYSPEFSSLMTLYGAPGASPAGGNYVGSDPLYQAGVPTLSQTLTSLDIGHTYTIRFWYAGAQAQPFSGATTEGWTVSLGGETHSTPTLNDPSQSFTGWQLANLNFTATAASELLSFTAFGGPAVGNPPFALLDGVSLVPEPATWAMFLIGFGGIGFMMRGSRRKQAGETASA